MAMPVPLMSLPGLLATMIFFGFSLETLASRNGPLTTYERRLARREPLYSEDGYALVNVTKIPWSGPPPIKDAISKSFIAKKTDLWPDGVVYYTLDDSYDNT